MNENTPATEPGRTLTPEQQALVYEFCRSLSHDDPTKQNGAAPTEAPEPDEAIPDGDNVDKQTAFQKGFVDWLNSFPQQDKTERNTLTGQPVFHGEDKAERYAWAMFGNLIAQGTFAIPERSGNLHDEKEESQKVLEDITSVVDDLANALRAVFTDLDMM